MGRQSQVILRDETDKKTKGHLCYQHDIHFLWEKRKRERDVLQDLYYFYDVGATSILRRLEKKGSGRQQQQTDRPTYIKRQNIFTSDEPTIDDTFVILTKYRKSVAVDMEAPRANLYTSTCKAKHTRDQKITTKRFFTMKVL